MHVDMASVWNRVKAAFTHDRLAEEDEGLRTVADDPSASHGGRSVSTDYTELMGGSVPCPSCKGTGRIPREMEETLVALIPVNDSRLKPKRTWVYVSAVIALFTLIAVGIMFLMLPRAVELHSTRPSIDNVNVFDFQEKTPSLKFHFINTVNVSNANYYSIQVQNTTATIISKFQPWSTEVIGSGANGTMTTVSPLSNSREQAISFNNTVSLQGVIAEYCTAPFSRLTSLYVNMQFDMVVTLSYFNHKEQISLSMVQQVCCIPTGNCTSSV